MNPQNDKLLIIGAGQYGLMAQEIAQAMDCFSEIAFLDDSYPSQNSAVIGSSRDIKKFAKDYRCGFVAIGNPEVRRKLVESLFANGIIPVIIVHPMAFVSPSAKLQPGCCVEPLAVVQTDASIATASFIASGAVVRHNAVVGEYCHVDCNAVVESTAVVPARTKVACNCVFSRGSV